MKSMTGYGKAEASMYGKTVTVEMKSVNHRFLEPSFRMPHILNMLEDELKRRLKNSLFRGKVDIYISYRDESDESADIIPNKPIIAAYLNQLKLVCEEYGVPYQPTTEMILRLPDVFIKNNQVDSEDDERIKEVVFAAFDNALKAFIDARAQEGENLKEDILSHLCIIEENVAKIKARAPEIEEGLRTKLRDKITGIIGDITADATVKIDEERLNTEVVYYVERAAIDEELVRLASHIKAMRKEVAAGDNVGKKMDFMVQEMNREINTIGSKSSDFDIASLVVTVKSQIEKIREQIQNVE